MSRLFRSKSVGEKAESFHAVEGEVNPTSDSSSSTFELFTEEDADKSYLAKSKLVADAIQEIGFGKYQIGLFFVAGFGWFSDNAWPVATSLILPRMIEVNGVHSPAGKGPYLTLAQNLGLLAGALFWSLSSDIIGRRWAFNLTFLITGIWAVVAGSSPNFAATGIFVSFWSFGVGGNLPVDSAIFLEALPASHQWLLTVMSGWWALGQIVANLISWGLIGNYSCTDLTNCQKGDNWGWRYFLFALGGLTLLMFAARFAFRVFESPRFYLARGQDAKAVETLNKIARINGKTNTLTLHDFEAIDLKYSEAVGGDEYENKNENENGAKGAMPESSTRKNKLIEEKLKRYNLSHVRQCFGSKKLAVSNSLIIFTWGLIGLAFPLYNAFLPYYLETRGDANKPLSVHDTYRNTLIVSVLGIPGAIIAGFLVELRIGRKGTLSVSLLLTGVMLFASTTARTSNANLGWNCMFSFFSNIAYGVLYAYTPECCFAQIRGTMVGLAASFNRIMGVFAPIIAIYADLTTSAPIFVSGALFLLSGLLVLCFPYEPRGKSCL
ncbi:hypothetical protein PVL30_002446 [Lodderomyces elongisporus]|uniref:Major facilitator superfamily (MFS) profile domain-containing protein n=1 Tax=Lodderomyces elongisporus (strain ATCC 11503 / CBS 2605 / JCM 1781 / NBRC 1676 / NRRL YB-4239) TaxID=379508 RepID=A5E6W2_LODEL|nr:uncharacterized protein PVL30_002446 [Lodderomyces elongisporus]EDK47170.1 conserved hypothetical protein [Lodderomyces elongisporus NRRL YB-4239]WLF78704.1 hypothetical protein PVL30_002446 [Lodderomyces elongisporus]